MQINLTFPSVVAHPCAALFSTRTRTSTPLSQRHASPHRTTSHHIAPHRTASHRTAPHRTASHRIAPHRTTSHRIAPHRTASHRIAPHRTASHRAAALYPSARGLGPDLRPGVSSSFSELRRAAGALLRVVEGPQLCGGLPGAGRRAPLRLQAQGEGARRPRPYTRGDDGERGSAWGTHYANGQIHDVDTNRTYSTA